MWCSNIDTSYRTMPLWPVDEHFLYFFLNCCWHKCRTCVPVPVQTDGIPERPAGSVVSTKRQWKNEENRQVVQKGYRGFFKESLKHRCKQIYCVGPAVGTIMVWTVVPASWSRNCPLGCRRPSCPATVSRHFRLFWPHPNVLVQILQIHRPLPTRPPMFFWVLWSRWGWKSMRLTKKKKSQ